jgi:hypothetical protein
MGVPTEGKSEVEYGVFDNKEAYLNFHSHYWDSHECDGRLVFSACTPLDCYVCDSRSDVDRKRRKGSSEPPNQIVAKINGKSLHMVTPHGGLYEVPGIVVQMCIWRRIIGPCGNAKNADT